MRFLKKMLLGIYIFLAVFAVICLACWVIQGAKGSENRRNRHRRGGKTSPGGIKFAG